MLMSTNPTFLLVHGSWHDGSCWSAVAERLNDAGFPTLTPTLAAITPTIAAAG